MYGINFYNCYYFILVIINKILKKKIIVFNYVRNVFQKFVYLYKKVIIVVGEKYKLMKIYFKI